MASLTDHVIVLDRIRPHTYRPSHVLKPGAGSRAAVLSPDDLAEIGDKLGISPEALGEMVRLRDAASEEFMHEPRRTGAQDDHGDVHHAGNGVYEVVPFACSCGAPLTDDLTEVLNAWTEHVGRVLKVDEEVRYHPLVRIIERDGVTEVDCSCGSTFSAPEEDPSDSAAAVASWAEHVAREVA